ncbi:MAG: type III pantothenate kinase [Bacteroidetes bacterium]|nr:type III pantothenate kinase [Rhodothermia bacterium]MCS7154612.1 type III pantothenate kinase [Bacteroidota bacterium]MCX7906329.1 type III pantothenate kinase [Bacteroidota bacterium]MDW8137405.1 type III pantothenate kinase [Bacteroidota bacterium]MDW8285641.1 type III pantothenate kinase [Bacteroidota bacterium]
MWLTVDIGNSTVVGGLFEGYRLVHTFQRRTDASAPVSAYVDWLREGIGDRSVERAGLVSVVPALTGVMNEAIQAVTGSAPLLVQPKLKLPVQMGYHTPETLGMDRLCGAAAAFNRHRQAVIVVDAGTALTFNVVDDQGVFLGGAITAGLELILRSLHQDTALLPEVNLQLPRYPVGRSTQACIQVGVLYGMIDLVTGLVQRIRKHLKVDSKVILTGGWSGFLSQYLPVDEHDPYLVLHGVRLIMTLNAPAETAVPEAQSATS